MDVLLGVDVGGTFTDFVAYDRESRGISVWKVPSVPGDPVAGILDGISQELSGDAIRLLRPAPRSPPTPSWSARERRSPM